MAAEGLSPREGVEHFRRLMPRAEIQQIADTYGVSWEEAETIAMHPIEWMAQLADGTAPVDVVDGAEATLAAYEDRFGQALVWDESRRALVMGLLTHNVRNRDLAVRLLARVQDPAYAIEAISDVGRKLMAHNRMDIAQFLALTESLRNAFIAAGRGEEFDSRNFQALSENHPQLLEDFARVNGLDPAGFGAQAQFTVHRFAVPDELRPPAPEAPQETPAPEESTPQSIAERYPLAPWAQLTKIAENINEWPDGMDLEARVAVVVGFGKQLNDVLSTGKIETKGAEALKAYITKQQKGRGGDVWDELRFIAAGSFYSLGGEKFGRSITRSMDDPAMMAMVVHFLLEDGRDAYAMEVMQDLPDFRIYGKMLAIGDWQDKERIAVMIEDITVVLPTAKRKYAPSFRLGVAKGLHEHFASSEGNDAEQAEKFRARADLLQRQIDSGYIKHARKK